MTDPPGFDVPWSDAEDGAFDRALDRVASRARKKLSDWYAAGVVDLDKPVHGFTQVSIDEMSRFMAGKDDGGIGFRVAHAALMQLEEQERLANICGKFDPALSIKSLKELDGIYAEELDKLRRSLGG